MEFRIGWWNTRLKYLFKAEGSTSKHLAAAAQIVAALMNQQQGSLLCLGEICNDSFAILNAQLAGAGFELIQLDENPLKPHFGMVAVYRPDKIAGLVATYETQLIEGVKRRLAVRLIAELPTGSILNLFLAHWPSRLYSPEGSPERDQMASFLRAKIEELFEADEDSKVVVVGDFNDDPYSRSISRGLMATKELVRISRNKRLLYNPFWGKLVHPTEVFRGGGMPPASGTYYYANGRVNRWHVFDQMLFSSAYFGESAEWHLDERNTHIIDHRFGLIPDLRSGEGFDHYPIMATIERREDERV